MPAVKKVNWTNLRRITKHAEGVTTRAEWEELLRLAESFDEATQELAIEHLYLFEPDPVTENVFCPTGEGGGRDPTCSPGKGGTGGAGAAANASGRAISMETHTPPPPGKAYKPNVEGDANGDGVTDHARVGVPANDTPPPPPIPRLPNLTPDERAVERDFAEAFESDPDGMAAQFLDVVRTTAARKGDVPTFGTDDAKVLSSKWDHPDLSPEERAHNRAVYNLALHQTANAVAKRSFVQHLDSLQPGDEIMVTVGGVGAGKGYALNNVPEALAAKGRAKAVWDSAGDQNATENPWILKEAADRGLRVNYVYVHANPEIQWAHPERGVVKRAQDPKDGRMVDAHVFADSYAIGAKNHSSFYEKNRNNPNATFTFIENGSPPRKLESMPGDALGMNRSKLREFALKTVHEQEGIPPRVQRGATAGVRVWGED